MQYWRTFSETPIAPYTYFPKKNQKMNRRNGRTFVHTSMDAEYFSTSAVFFAPTIWLIIMEDPTTIEKQKEREVHTGLLTLPMALR